MDDIKRVRLGDIAELITKGTTPTTLGFDFQDEGINFLKIECFDENGSFLPKKVAFISEECNEKLKRSQLKAGDVLFSIAGAIGRVAIVTEEMLPANTNQALAIIRITDENVYLPYIKLILTSPIVKKQFEKKKQGVAQLNLSLKDINEIVIPLPDKKRQIEYAELFGKLYGVITLRNTQLSDMDNIIKARFVELFGTLDNPAQEFAKSTLKELCNKITDGKHGGCIQEDGTGRYFVGAREIFDDEIHYDTAPQINTEEFEKDYKRCNVDIGDFLIVNTGATIGKSAIASDARTTHTLLQKSVALLKVKQDVLNPVFLKWCYRVNTKMYLVESASAQPNLLLSKINSTVIYVPDIDLQNRFADFAKQVDKSKVVVQKALDETQTLFDSLMQEYFG
ncbi:restriction endonuclease subunit S [Butyrivibrio sp. XPD2006]|uniref:restriction endonuclease subunit S n=1 Tax=Butyrivibrio sp. XPD2006 TaxID=1280668 RepID=UPI0003B3C05D|nr:restriction endonuclease subunit S [Butyrivibrio sp. XPD2006]